MMQAGSPQTIAVGKRLLRLAAILVLHLPATALAERITYKLFDVASGLQPILISRGVRKYSLKDVVVEAHSTDRGPTWSKEIPVADGFYAGAVI